MKKPALLLLIMTLSGLRLAAAVTSDVRYEQRIGEALPLGTLLTDEGGRTRTLASYLDGKPAVLIFKYFRCPELCSLVSSGATDSLRQLRQSVGRDYSVLTVSIDPTDTPEMARSHQRSDVSHYGRTGSAAGWHALVGTPAQIQALADAAGFHFSYDPRSRQYAHPSGLVVVTPQGIISSYFLGVDFPAAGLASALDRAAQNRTGPSVFSLLFICFQGGDPQGRYGRLIWAVLSVGVAVTVVSVGGGIGLMLRNEARSRRAGEGARR